MIDILSCTLEDFRVAVKERINKGPWYSDAWYRSFFQNNLSDIEWTRAFTENGHLLRGFRDECILPEISVESCQQGDSVQKFTSRLADGASVESVLIDYGRRKSLCISTQVGCARACAFCATGDMGFVRNLSVSEVLWQVYAARFILASNVDSVVFMGMGEPLDNYDVLVQSLRVLQQQQGFDIQPSSVTVSTAGRIDNLRRLMNEGFCNLRIALSLHSVDPGVRRRIMPITGTNSLKDLRSFMQNAPLKKRELFLIEYTLFKGINDSAGDAGALAQYLAGIPCRVNILSYNGREGTFRSVGRESMYAFRRMLEELGLRAFVRESRGDKLRAACGQLATKDGIQNG
ncbi:MAG: radical SAM protein [Fibrobacterota bacterium]